MDARHAVTLEIVQTPTNWPVRRTPPPHQRWARQGTEPQQRKSDRCFVATCWLDDGSDLGTPLRREQPIAIGMAPVTISTACFRYVPPGLPEGEESGRHADLVNERLMAAIRREGRTFPSNATLNGRYCLRACIVNFRTEADDIDALLDSTIRLGRQIHAELRPRAPG